MTIRWKAVEQYFTVVLFVFNFTLFFMLGNLSILTLKNCQEKGLSKDDGSIYYGTL